MALKLMHNSISYISKKVCLSVTSTLVLNAWIPDDAVKILEANYQEEETIYQLARRGNVPKRCSRIGISTASWPGRAETPVPAPNSEQR
jgi:hypothetical protein